MSAQRVSGIKPSDSSTAWDTAPPHALGSKQPHYATFSLFDGGRHTLRVHSFTKKNQNKTLLYKPKISNLDSSVYNAFFQSSAVHYSYVRKWVKALFRISSGFLSATWPVKAASLLFTIETEICLLRPFLSCAWNCCCESHTGCGLSETSNSVVGLGLPDFLLSVSPSL